MEKKKTQNKTHNSPLSLFRFPLLHHTQTGVSEDAKAFVRSLLDRDPAKRPTAAEALRHPWLAGGTSAER